MEIKSSLLKYKEFNYLKDSIIKISSIDGKDKFRVKLVEYINDTSDNNDDMFFYEMLPFARFLKPSDQAIAYTTPDHLIYLNSPGIVGENVRKWDFIYCHECLHQLWDTFEVGEKIKKAGLEYNHKILNIASDCVINDYLKTLRNKEPFENGIFPETLKKEFNIDYDRKNDTQYSLYIKLLNVYEENKNKLENLIKQMEKQEGDGGTSGNSGSSSGSSSNNKQDKDLTANGAQKSANEAKKHAENAQKQANSNKAAEESDKTPSCDPQESQEHADKAKDAAKRAQEAADKAKECADKGDKEGEKKAAKEAAEAAEEAENESLEAGGKETKGEGESEDKIGGDDGVKSNEKGEDGESSESGESDEAGKDGETGKDSKHGKKGGKEAAKDNTISDITPEELEEIRKSAKEIINKYKNKLTGPLGDFLSKCNSSSSLKREGLKVKTSYGNAGWNTQMNKICKAFVKKKIFQKKRQYEKTYSRVKRGSGFVKFGNPIEPGRKIKEDKMDINVAFYIDRSGSMDRSIDNVFGAVFYIADALKKYFGKEKVVNDTIFESYAFDVSLHKLKFGQKMKADGGTMSFNKLLDYVNEYSKDFLINVIVTDAQFSNIDTSTIKNLLKDINGILIFITNIDNETIKELSDKQPDKLHYILANSEFTLD